MTDVEKKTRYLSMIRELTENFPVCDRPELVVARKRLAESIGVLIEALDWFTEEATEEAEAEFDNAFETFSLALFHMRKLKEPHTQKRKKKTMDV